MIDCLAGSPNNKDLGALSYILGIKVIPTPNSILQKQKKKQKKRERERELLIKTKGFFFLIDHEVGISIW